MARLDIRLLGTPRIKVDGVPIAVDTRKAIALLAYLAVTPDAQRRESLASLLWPDYDDVNGRATLRRTLSSLRKALGDRWLIVSRDSLGLERSGVELDVERFRGLLSECGSHGHGGGEVCSACLPLLTGAAELYRGDFLGGFTLRDSPEFEEWQFFNAEQFRRELDSLLDRLVQAHAARGELTPAIEYARRRLQLDSLNESAHAALIRLYALAGDRSGALRQYRDCVRVLNDELGVEPLEETTQLYEAVFAGEFGASLVLPTADLGDTRVGSSQVTATAPKLVGREAELSSLIGALEQSKDTGLLLVIEGEAGIGKTALLQEFQSRLLHHGINVLTGHCYEGEVNLAYAPVLTLLKAAAAQLEAADCLASVGPSDLAEAARILPELSSTRPGLPVSPALDSPGAQVRFFDGIIEILSALTTSGTTALLAVEDIHWADEASLDFFTYFARRLKGRPLALAFTWRTEEVAGTHRLRQLLAERQRAGAAEHVLLGRLDARSVEELVTSAGLGNAPAALKQRLFQETEGLPFFIVQYLNVLSQSGDGEWSMPAGIRDLLRSRLSHVDGVDLQILGAGAAIGRSFAFGILCEASGRSEEEAIAAVERLVAQGFLRPVPSDDNNSASVYDFSHERLRAFIYEETSAIRRKRLHRRIADALARTTGPKHASTASQVAQHYRLAGNDAEAAEYFKLAGEHAQSLHANVEALAHFRAALAAGHESPAPLHQEIGELLTLAGSYGEALNSYQRAAALTEPGGQPAIEHKIGALYLRLGQWALAEQHFVSALNGYGEDNAGERARVLADLSLAAHRQGNSTEAASLAEQALLLVGSSNDRLAEAQAHNISGVLASGRGHFDTAILHLKASLTLAEHLGDATPRIAALNNLALAVRAKGDIESALGLTETAIGLCVQIGDRHREAALRNNLADLLRAEGKVEASMANLKQAVTIFAEIGSETGMMEPEIWKLVEW